MSSGLPTASSAIATSGAPAPMESPLATSGPAAAGQTAPPSEPAPLLSQQEISTAIRDLTWAVANLRTFLQEFTAPSQPGQGFSAPPPPPPAAPFTPPPPPPPTAVTSQQGIPITQIRFPPSPSQLPTWLAAPVYTTAPAQPTVLHPAASPSATTFGGFTGYADPYTGAGGHQFQGGPMVPNYSPPAAMSRHEGAVAVAPLHQAGVRHLRRHRRPPELAQPV
uniref:Uncharacterized protein n=1 Tax=Avena sativa TaxID=4498 RepID=A0ACD5Z7M2_AVESA